MEQIKTSQDCKAVFLDFLDSHAGPGFEESLGAKVREAFLQFTSTVDADPLGNVVASVAGEGFGRHPRVLLAAHMDEIALVVTCIETGGFLRVAQTGGFDPRTLVGQEVFVHGKERLLGVIGSKPPHLTSPAERRKAAPLEDLYIDLALPQEEVIKRVIVGDRVTLKRDTMELLNERVSGKALDNRTSLAILLECLRMLRGMVHAADVFAVATVQEEVGVRGAATAGYGVNPDIAVAVDVTFADMPGQREDVSFAMDKGPAVSFGPNIHPKLFAKLKDIAIQNGIPWKLGLTQRPTGTDGRALQIARDGIATAVVGIPLRYMHTSVETGSYNDIVACGRLLAHFIAAIDTDMVEGLSCY